MMFSFFFARLLAGKCSTCQFGMARGRNQPFSGCRGLHGVLGEPSA